MFRSSTFVSHARVLLMEDWPRCSKIYFSQMYQNFWQWPTHIFIKNRTLYSFSFFSVRKVRIDSGFNKWWTREIDLFQKSHNATASHVTMHHFVSEMCSCVHISVTNAALWDICLILWGICKMGLFVPRYAITRCYIRALHDTIGI